MKKFFIFLSFLVVFMGCSKPTFIWKSEAKEHLSMYQKTMFEGDAFQADFYYREALAEARKSSSLTPIAMIYLSSCAMHQALFLKSDCLNYKKIRPLVKDTNLDAYEAFILGQEVEAKAVEKYAAVIESIKASNKEAVAARINDLNSIYSKAVAASVAAKKALLSEALIDHMIYEASKHSMRQLMQVWMEQKLLFLKNEGREVERLELEEKLKFLAH